MIEIPAHSDTQSLYQSLIRALRTVTDAAVHQPRVSVRIFPSGLELPNTNTDGVAMREESWSEQIHR